MAEGRLDLLSLTVDGVRVQVPRGTRVIEAAERAGVVVPHYCYHPGIPSRPAQCRMCLVAIEGQKKLQPSCVLDAQEGMAVRTDTEEAERARKSVIEFLLLNHPLDCPICDAAGQCMLQDYAFETRQLQSRFREEKLVLGRDRIADDILYFADRCIVCTRCVRFMRDVAGEETLIVAQRGHKAYIDTFPGRDLENAFRGNIVDVCPVGALVHEDFLFKARAWDLDSAPGICPGCSTGCNVMVDAKENQIVRLKPRFNPEVNSYWMCDYGRKRFVMANRGVRCETPLVREGADLVPADWESALVHVARRLAPGTGGTAIVAADESNESLYYLRRLLDYLGIEEGGFRLERGEEATLHGFPKLRLRAERSPNARGAELLGFHEIIEPPVGGSRALVVLGEDLVWAGEDFGTGTSFFLYLGHRLPPAAANADAVLPVTSFAEMEGTFTNFEGRVQRFHRALEPPGIARPAWMVLSHLLGRLGLGEAALDVRAAFAALADGVPGFAGLTWDGLGLRGAPARDGAAAPAAARGGT